MRSVAAITVGLLAVAIASASCSAPSDRAAGLERALADRRVAGAISPGTRVLFEGTSRVPTSLKAGADNDTTVFSEGARFTSFWREQAAGSVPGVAWREEIVLVYAPTRSAATALSFDSLILGAGRFRHLTIVGDTAPLTQVRYNYPLLILAVPRAGPDIRVRLLHTEAKSSGGWTIINRGELTQISTERTE